MQNNRNEPIEAEIISISSQGGMESKKSQSKTARAIMWVLDAFQVIVITITILGVGFFAGMAYSQAREKLDKPVSTANLGTPRDAMLSLTTQSAYLKELSDVAPTGWAINGRTSPLLAARLQELELLKQEAATLLAATTQGKADAQQLRKFQELRGKIRALPSLAGKFTLLLLTENIVLVLLIPTLFALFGIFCAPYLDRKFKLARA